MTITWTARLALVWLVSLPLVAHRQAWVWADEAALWRQAAAWSPLKLRPWVQLGEHAYAHGDLEQAAVFFDRAIRMFERGHRPRFERTGCEIAVHNLRVTLRHQGLEREAEARSVNRCGGPF